MNNKSEILTEILIIVSSIFVSFIIVYSLIFFTYNTMTDDCVERIEAETCKNFNNLFYMHVKSGGIANGERVKGLLNFAEGYAVEVMNNISGDIANENHYKISYEYEKYGWLYDKLQQ